MKSVWCAGWLHKEKMRYANFLCILDSSISSKQSVLIDIHLCIFLRLVMKTQDERVRLLSLM